MAFICRATTGQRQSAYTFVSVILLLMATPMMRMRSSVNASGTRWMILRYLMA